MSKNTSSPVVLVRSQDVVAALLHSLNGGNDEESEQYDMVANIYFDVVSTTTRKTFFH